MRWFAVRYVVLGVLVGVLGCLVVLNLTDGRRRTMTKEEFIEILDRAYAPPDTVTVIAWEPVPPVIIYRDAEPVIIDRTVVFYP